jgi:hypothetical protein
VAHDPISPPVLLSSAVLRLLVAIDRHRKLEAVIFVIGNHRIVRQTDITDWDCRDRLRSQASGTARGNFSDSLIRDVHEKANGLSRFEPEITRNESLTISVDEVAGDVLPQG